jgi:hypothetical protein
MAGGEESENRNLNLEIHLMWNKKWVLTPAVIRARGLITK